jgi:hypothetical protein
VERCSQEEWTQVFNEVMTLIRAGQLVMADTSENYELMKVHQAVAAAEAGLKGKILLRSWR